MEEYLMGLSIPYPRIAYLYASISYISVASFQVFAKMLYDVLDPFALIIFRASFLMMINTAVLSFCQERLDINNTKVFRSVMKRMIFSVMSIVPTLYCVKYIPVSTNVTFQNMSPILSFFIEAILFHKSFILLQLGLTSLSFVGVVLILQPVFLFDSGSNSQFNSPFEIFVVLFSVFGALCISMNLAFIHDQAGKVPKAVNLQCTYIARLFFGGTLINLFGAHITFSGITFKHVLAFVMFILLSFALQYLMFIANSLKKPSKIQPFGYISVIISFACDVWYFGEEFNGLAVIGIGLTSIGLLSKLLQEEDNSDAKQIKSGHLQSQLAKSIKQ